MEEEKKVEELQIMDETEKSEEILPERYSGSGENRNPSRVLKIDEIVKWDMNFGVVVGPAGYDHRLRCPYCGKRLLLLEYEGGRDRTGIRIAYRCENCSAHSVVSFLPPGQSLELDEVAYGERIVVEKPTPVPNTPAERDSGRPQRRERQNQNQRGNQGNRGALNQPGENSAQAQSNPRNQQRRNQNQRPAATGERAERDNRSRQRGNDSQRGNEGQRSAQQGSRSQNAPAGERGERNERAENQNRRRQNTRDQGGAVAPDVQAISEAVQDQADKTATRRPYQRRRRRPFRPPTTPSSGTDS